MSKWKLFKEQFHPIVLGLLTGTVLAEHPYVPPFSSHLFIQNRDRVQS